MFETNIPALETSADSRKMVFMVAMAWAFIWLTAFLNFVLTDGHQDQVDALLREIDTSIIPVTLFSALLIAAIGFYLLDFHEAVYDRLLVKWRSRHESEFILPRLFGPFRERFVADYGDLLKANSKDFIRSVFCPFVSGKNHRLDPRFISKFYKALTLYWVAELTEIAIIAWLASTFFYALWGRTTGAVPVAWQAVLLFQVCGAIALGVANNLIFVRFARRVVRDRTQDEIDEIMRYYARELEQHVMEAAREFKMLRLTPEPSRSIVQITSPRPGVTLDHRRAFLASPMSSLAPAEYLEDREVMCSLVKVLKEKCGFEHVFYAGERLPEQARLEDNYLALDADLREIRRSGVFIFHYPHRLPSSALFELGYALALGKRIVLLVHDHNHLPFLLRAASQLDHVVECSYKDPSDLLAVVTRSPETLFGPEVAERIAAGNGHVEGRVPRPVGEYARSPEGG